VGHGERIGICVKGIWAREKPRREGIGLMNGLR